MPKPRFTLSYLLLLGSLTATSTPAAECPLQSGKTGNFSTDEKKFFVELENLARAQLKGSDSALIAYRIDRGSRKKTDGLRIDLPTKDEAPNHGNRIAMPATLRKLIQDKAEGEEIVIYNSTRNDVVFSARSFDTLESKEGHSGFNAESECPALKDGNRFARHASSGPGCEIVSLDGIGSSSSRMGSILYGNLGSHCATLARYIGKPDRDPAEEADLETAKNSFRLALGEPVSKLNRSPAIPPQKVSTFKEKILPIGETDVPNRAPGGASDTAAGY